MPARLLVIKRVSARAAFAERYSEAKVRPRYEVEESRNGNVLVTVHEARGDYLVKSVYDTFFDGGGLMVNRLTVEAQGKDMQPIGRPATYTDVRGLSIICSHTYMLDYDNSHTSFDKQALLDALASGDAYIMDQDKHIDRYLSSIKQYRDRKNRYEAEYAKRTQGGLE